MRNASQPTFETVLIIVAARFRHVDVPFDVVSKVHQVISVEFDFFFVLCCPELSCLRLRCVVMCCGMLS